VGAFYGVIAGEEELYHLVVVVVGGEYQGGDIGGELALLVRTKEGVFAGTLRPFSTLHVVWVLNHHSNCLRCTLHRIQESNYTLPFLSKTTYYNLF